MNQHEFHLLDKLEVPVIDRAYLAHDDLAALKEVERFRKTHTIEVWQGDRRVVRVKKGNAALVSEDRPAL
ncbi:MAG TPA: hypothetical protein VMO78_03895 [Rhizomicrobium sp.]|nr:hypothetical protein [Rhizomicrobium sp.]